VPYTGHRDKTNTVWELGTLPVEYSVYDPPSGRASGINLGEPAPEASQLEDEAPPPPIQLMDSDAVNTEVLPQTQVLESSTMTLAVEVEKTEERIATKYKRKKRSHYGRDTTYDSAQLSG